MLPERLTFRNKTSVIALLRFFMSSTIPEIVDLLLFCDLHNAAEQKFFFFAMKRKLY
jgi:hypothetical protein